MTPPNGWYFNASVMQWQYWFDGSLCETISAELALSHHGGEKVVRRTKEELTALAGDPHIVRGEN